MYDVPGSAGEEEEFHTCGVKGSAGEEEFHVSVCDKFYESGCDDDSSVVICENRFLNGTFLLFIIIN